MDPIQQFKNILSDSTAAHSLVRAVFSRPVDKSRETRRVDVRPIELRHQPFLQFSARTSTQEFHQNLPPAEALQKMLQLVGSEFRDAWCRTSDQELQLRIPRRGPAVLQMQEKPPAPSSTPTGHDRTPNYLIPEGTPCAFLQYAGVMDASGRVRKKAYSKFRQVNHYLSLIHSCLDELPDVPCLHVVDYGCGKSYLTFATHHLIRNILGRNCHVTGLDLRRDVVETCQKAAVSLSLEDIEFQRGSIDSFQPRDDVHLAMSLHACDTATDDAICNAVGWQTPVILAVPCCQHELATQLGSQPERLPLIRGVLVDRYAALATDAMRAGVLRAAGYRTDIIEFIETDHTPKNLMIRAIRRRGDCHAPAVSDARDELRAFREIHQLPPMKLERLLLDPGHSSE